MCIRDSLYHAVDTPPLFHRPRGLYVTPRHLARQLGELQAGRLAEFTTLGEWNRQRPSGRQVAVTFDDAYRSLYVNGLPVLQELGVHAVTYVVVSFMGRSNEWDHGGGARHEPLMDRAHLGEWIDAGHEIGSQDVYKRQVLRLRDPNHRQREGGDKT